MKRKILRLIIIFYSITLLLPNIAYDYIIEYTKPIHVNGNSIDKIKIETY